MPGAGRDEERDRSIAKHVMGVHINASGVKAGAQEGDIDIATMKKYVSYCRLKCAPRLSEAAASMLSSQVSLDPHARAGKQAGWVIPCCSASQAVLVSRGRGKRGWVGRVTARGEGLQEASASGSP